LSLTIGYNVTIFDVNISNTVILMPQHFLLSSQARTLSLSKVMRLSDAEAFETFKRVRWASNKGKPFCPRCGCVEIYGFKTRRIFKCKGCEAQFSVTTGTIFASRKLSLRDILAAIAIFVNSAKGHSALQLSRDLDVQYKTAFVLSHKIREALSTQSNGKTVSGEVEIDGAYFGGYVKPENKKADRKDLRLAVNRSGKRQCVVISRVRVYCILSGQRRCVAGIERYVIRCMGMKRISHQEKRVSS